MGLVLRRWLVSLLFMSLLAMVGGLIGLRLEAPVLGTWAGAVCGLLLAGVRDARRAGRLVAWLRGNLEGMLRATANCGVRWPTAPSAPCGCENRR